MKKLFFLLLMLCLCTGLFIHCTITYPGISPDPSKIHYPIGIAVHPTGRYLYVANSNFDLAFTGGTLMAFDAKEDPKNTIVVPVNGFQTEHLTLKLVSNGTVEIGSFAGEMLVNQSGTRAYLTVRQDRIAGSWRKCSSDEDCKENDDTRAEEECVRELCRLKQTINASSILSIKLNQIPEDGTATATNHFDCDNKAISSNETGGIGVEGGKGTPAPRCGDKSKLFMEDNPFPYSLNLVRQCRPKRDCQADTDCKCTDEDKKNGLCLVDEKCDTQSCVKSCKDDSNCGNAETCQAGLCQAKTPSFCTTDTDCGTQLKCKDTRLLVTHLARGGFSDITLPIKGWETLSYTARSKLRQVKGFPQLPQSVVDLDILRSSAALGTSGEIFLSSRSSNEIYVLPQQTDTQQESALLKLPFANASQGDSNNANFRGMTFGLGPHKKEVRLFIAARQPSSVLAFALQRSPDNGALQVRLVATIPVGAEPGQIVYRRRGEGLSDLLYVVCSREQRVDVIDARTYSVVHQIKVGQQPYFMAIYEPPPSAGKNHLKHRRAYVANFLDTSISIIDLDRHRVIGLIKGQDTKLVVSP